MLRQVAVRFLLLALIALPCVGCDQVTKHFAREHLAGAATRTWLHDTLRLQYAENHGAFLSAGQGMSAEARRVVLTGGSALLIAGTMLALLLARDLSVYSAVALALIIAGGFGNLYDRLLHNGVVVDFMNIGLGRLRTGIFNFADVHLLIGVLMLLLAGRVTSPRWRKD